MEVLFHQLLYALCIPTLFKRFEHEDGKKSVRLWFLDKCLDACLIL